MKKLFLELPVLFNNNEFGDATPTFEQIADYSALTPAMVYINVRNILTIEDDPFHGDKFSLMRFNDDAFCIPMSKEELVNKIHIFISEENKVKQFFKKLIFQLLCVFSKKVQHKHSQHNH